MPRESRDVTVRDVRLRVVEAGDPRSPALVLVHGFLVSHTEFDDVIDDLAARFHVIAPVSPAIATSSVASSAVASMIPLPTVAATSCPASAPAKLRMAA